MSITNLPCHEADCFHDRGLNDFLAWEHTPSHGIRTIGMGVGAKITALVNHIICDVMVAFDVREEQRQEGGADEELEVRLFLVDEHLLFRTEGE